MNDVFQQRVRAAADRRMVDGAGRHLFSCLGLDRIPRSHVGSTRLGSNSLLGPGVSWEYVQNVGFWAISIFKMCIWLMALVVVWLTLWANQLEKRSG